jgi:hypothetical protein
MAQLPIDLGVCTDACCMTVRSRLASNTRVGSCAGHRCPMTMRTSRHSGWLGRMPGSRHVGNDSAYRSATVPGVDLLRRGQVREFNADSIDGSCGLGAGCGLCVDGALRGPAPRPDECVAEKPATSASAWCRPSWLVAGGGWVGAAGGVLAVAEALSAGWQDMGNVRPSAGAGPTGS